MNWRSNWPTRNCVVNSPTAGERSRSLGIRYMLGRPLVSRSQILTHCDPSTRERVSRQLQLRLRHQTAAHNTRPLWPIKQRRSALEQRPGIPRGSTSLRCISRKMYDRFHRRHFKNGDEMSVVNQLNRSQRLRQRVNRIPAASFHGTVAAESRTNRTGPPNAGFPLGLAGRVYFAKSLRLFHEESGVISPRPLRGAEGSRTPGLLDATEAL